MLNSSIFIAGDFVQLKSFQVEEGSEAVITTQNIKVLVDFEKFGISSGTAVLFHIIELPKHGVLSFGSNIKKTQRLFSLDQLRSNKIKYSHNGKETVSDSFVFEMEIDTDAARPGQQLPAYFSSRQRYLFEIRVLPVNDKPQLRSSLGHVLTVPAGARFPFPPQFLQVRK